MRHPRATALLGRLAGQPLPAVDATTGEVLATGPEEPCITTLSVSPGERLLALGGCDGTVSLYQLDALLGERSWTARLGHTPTSSAVTGLAFDTAREAVVASYSGGRVAAWSLGEVMTELWSFDAGDVVKTPRVAGDTLWLGVIDRLLPGERPTGGVIGLPLDPSELLDFARLRVSRDLTDAECQRYLGGPCSPAD